MKVAHFTLDDFQTKAFFNVLAEFENGNDRVVLVSPTGSGKCHGAGTKVMLSSGTVVNVEHVLPGWSLMGPDSRPRRVLSVCRGRGPLYRVVPKKGDPYVVNEDHILSLKMTPGSSHSCGKQYPDGSLVEISVRDYLRKNKTFRHCAKGWRTGVEFDPREVSGFLPPYLLGLWLGDGHSRSPCVTTAEPEIESYLRQYAERSGLHVREEPAGCAKTIHLSSGRNGTIINMFRAQLQNQKLILNKHIPVRYLRNSREARMDLLAGIIDADGELSGAGYIISQKSSRLSKDIAYLARSLGLAAYVKSYTGKCTNTGSTGTYHRISISGDCHLIPVRVQRKVAPERRQTKDVLSVGIKDVEPLGEGDYFGFELEGDGLYLLGDFTVTHNTVMAMAFADYALRCGFTVGFITSGRQLIFQTADTAVEMKIPHTVLMANSGQPFDPRAPMHVISKDTLEARLKKMKDYEPPDLMLVDEADVALSKKWIRILEQSKRVIGLTATPVDGRGRSIVGPFYKSIVSAANYTELIRTGRLVDIPEGRVFSPYRPDLTGVSTSAGDFATKELAQLMDRDRLVGVMVAEWQKHGIQEPTVVHCVDSGHTVHTCEAFNGAGIPAEYILQSTGQEDREAIFMAVRRGETSVVVNCQTLTRGWNEPCISVCVLAKPTKRLRTYLQMVGRVIRSHPGKRQATLIDHSGGVWRHGWPTDDRDWDLPEGETIELTALKKKGEAKEPYHCPKCNTLWDSGRKCPNCGYAHAKRGQMATTVDGKLVRVKKKQSKKALDKDSPQAKWMMMLAVAARRGMTYGQVSAWFYRTFGEWPSEAKVGPLADHRSASKVRVRTLWPGFARGSRDA